MTDFLMFLFLQYNLKVKYKVTPTNQATAVLTWTKSCTVIQTRSGIQISSLTRTESTTGGESDATVSLLDFGTTFQSGDSVTVSCKVMQTVTSTGTTTDRTTPAPVTSTETMIAQDKVMTLN